MVAFVNIEVVCRQIDRRARREKSYMIDGYPYAFWTSFKVKPASGNGQLSEAEVFAPADVFLQMVVHAGRLIGEPDPERWRAYPEHTGAHGAYALFHFKRKGDAAKFKVAFCGEPNLMSGFRLRQVK